MTMYAIEKADGGVAIMVVRDGADPETEISRLHPASQADYAFPLVIREIAEGDLPSSEEFFDAWEDDGTVVGVNMGKARDIHMDRIRRVRDAELKKLDVEYQRADERGDSSKAEVAARKQALRDIPQTFDLAGASTPEDLVEMWPEDLPPPGQP